MLKEILTVKNKSGLHARPATMLAKLSKRYESQIEMVHKDKTIKMKSVLSILSAGITRGSELEIVCNGYDELAAMAEIKALFSSGFGEE